MEYGRIIYDFISDLIKNAASADESFKQQVFDEVDYLLSLDEEGVSAQTWANVDQKSKDAYNEIAMKIIREYIKSSPL